MATRTFRPQTTVTAGQAIRAGGLAAAVATAADLLLYGVARVLGIGLEIPLQPGAARQVLPVGMVVAAAVFGAAGGTIAQALLRRFVRPAGVFPAVGIALLLLSLGAPLSLGATGAATKATLVVMHLVTGAIIIGLLIRTNRASVEGSS